MRWGVWGERGRERERVWHRKVWQWFLHPGFLDRFCRHIIIDSGMVYETCGCVTMIFTARPPNKDLNVRNRKVETWAGQIFHSCSRKILSRSNISYLVLLPAEIHVLSRSRPQKACIRGNLYKFIFCTSKKFTWNGFVTSPKLHNIKHKCSR